MTRTRLIQRIEAVRPQLVVVSAPAGYGKTTLALELAGRYAGSSYVGFAGTSDAMREIELVHREFEAEPTRRRFIVFDDLDALANEALVRGGVARVIAAAPDETTIVLCTSTPGELVARVAPHRIVTFGESDLSFDDSEVAAALALPELEASQIAAVQHMTRGWPIAVLVFARFVRESDLAQALRRAPELAENLRTYLKEQVVSRLDTESFSALLTLSTTPQAREWDVQAGLAARLPFVSVARDGSVVVHPLVRVALARQYPELCAGIVAATASRAAENGDWLRVAACALESSDMEGAAAALDCIDGFFFTDLPDGYGALAEKIEPLYFTAYPNLWVASVGVRRYLTSPHTLQLEGQEVWGALPQSAPPIVRATVGCIFARLLADLGRFDEAFALLAQFPEMPPEGEEPSREAVLAAAFRAALHAELGHCSDAEQTWKRVMPFAGRSMLAKWLYLRQEFACVRAQGDTPHVRALLERTMALSTRSPYPIMVMTARAEASFSAWIAGDEDTHIEHLRALCEVLQERPNPTFRAYADAAAGIRAAVPPLAPHWRAKADLLRCGSVGDLENALFAARHAFNAAREAADPYLIVLSSVAVATLSPSLRDTVIQSARKALAGTELVQLREALDAFEQGAQDLPLLGPLVERLNRLSRETGAALTLHFLNGEVLHRGTPLALSELGRAFLFALGSAPQRNRDELLEMLWPTLSEKAAATALRMCVYRVRNNIGDAGAIIATKDGYALAASAARDLPLLEGELHRRRSDAPLEEALRQRFEVALEAVHAGRPARLAALEWWEPVEARIVRLGGELAAALAADALRSADAERAFELGMRLLDRDACDQVGCEIAMRAKLLMEDHEGAALILRRHASALEQELGVPVADELRALLPVTLQKPAANVVPVDRQRTRAAAG